MMMLLFECRVFVYEVKLMWWCCWGSVLFLWIRWGWCDDVVEWVSCVCVRSEDDVMRVLSAKHVFVYEVRMMWCGYWMRRMCLCMKWGWCDDDVEWVLCVCLWSKHDVMLLLSECLVFVYKVRMMWWCCWLSIMCLRMKWGWCDNVVEWVSCVCVWSEDDVIKLLS